MVAGLKAVPQLVSNIAFCLWICPLAGSPTRRKTMRHIFYAFFLAILLTLPAVVLGITAHFQTFAVRYGHKLQMPFSYIIGIAFLTWLGAGAHLVNLILEAQASASGLRVRKVFRAVELVVTLLLFAFWLGVVSTIATRERMGLIGGCKWNPPVGYVYVVTVEPDPQICKEWAVSLACASTTTVAIFAWWMLLGAESQDAFVARVWKRRQQQANQAKGIVAPPAIAPAGDAQAPIPLAAPEALQAAGLKPDQEPPLTTPPSTAPPPMSTDIEAEAGRGNENPRQASSSPMTSPASPPPTALRSWVQPSTIIGPLHEQIPGTAADSNVPPSPAAHP